jgi:hypothetical protein
MPPATFTARQNEIAAEMVALTGCSERHARIAAGSYLTFPNAPNYGLGGLDDQFAAASASLALTAWLSARDAAEIARKVAA